MMFLSTLLLSLAFASPAPDELLPDAPDGWRYERIDFPLSFAPELDYDGFEELRFAPGMFDADSDTYFSYALAIRIQGEHRIDEAFAERFLNAYYTGLAKAVGEGNNVDLSSADFGVEVERHDTGLLAHVDTVDSFVTGQQLRLRFELSYVDGPGYVEMFGVASPFDTDAPVWKDLHQMQAKWIDSHTAPVFLNHLYVIPDPETYQALVGSPELRELIVTEERTTVRRDFSYTGFYLYGHETYFEFLQASDSFPAGESGLAVGVEREGATEDVMAALASQEIGTQERDVTRELEGEQVPWFRMMGVQRAHERSRIQLFMLEYVPSFLGAWHPGVGDERPGIERSAVLARYAHVLGHGADHDGMAIEDVTDVYVRADDAERDYLEKVAAAFAYRVEETDGALTLHGPRYRLHLAPSEGPGAITRIDLRLRKPLEREPLQLGSYRLVFEGDRAAFHFE